MNDREKISRFLGAAISECSSSKYDEVRKMLVVAMRRLGEVREDMASKATGKEDPSFARLSPAQKSAALHLIDDMIEGEKSKLGLEGKETNLFG